MRPAANHGTVPQLEASSLQPVSASSWNAVRARVVVLTSIAIVLDGFDNQTLSLALPVLSEAWGVPREAFAAALAFGLLGMSASTILAGSLGDRFGPQRMLVLSLLVFGGSTAATATAHGLSSLVLFRILTCLGLGAAMPNAVAIVSDFSSARRRPMVVTLVILCIPLGGGLASFTAAQVLPVTSWNVLFLVAGILPIVFAIALGFWLPESLVFLARQPARHAEVAHQAKRFPEMSASRFTGQAGTRVNYLVPIAWIFSRNYRRDTLALWLAFGASLSAVYTCYNWMPAVLTAAGMDIATASTSMVFLNAGGIAGGVTAAWLITRVGSRIPMPAMAVFGALAVVPLSLATSLPAQVGLLQLSMTAEGFLLNGVQSSLFALIANAYQAECRATGVGTVVGAGRLVAIGSSFAVAPLVASSGSRPVYFAVLASFLGIGAGAITLVRRQIQGHNGRGS